MRVLQLQQQLTGGRFTGVRQAAVFFPFIILTQREGPQVWSLQKIFL